MLVINDRVILRNDLETSLEDIEECIDELGYDPRDGVTIFKVLDAEDDFGNVGIDIDGMFYIPANICSKID